MTATEARSAVVAVIVDLIRIQHRVFEIAEDLEVPWDVTEMWEGNAPSSFPGELFGACRAVRNGPLTEAIATLREAVHKSDADLRFLFRGRGDLTPEAGEHRGGPAAEDTTGEVQDQPGPTEGGEA